MEARDLGNTITLYLPQASGGAAPYKVFQDRLLAGEFATQEESLGFALSLAETISKNQGVPVRVRKEDEAGLWQTVDAAN